MASIYVFPGMHACVLFPFFRQFVITCNIQYSPRICENHLCGRSNLIALYREKCRGLSFKWSSIETGSYMHLKWSFTNRNNGDLAIAPTNHSWNMKTKGVNGPSVVNLEAKCWVSQQGVERRPGQVGDSSVLSYKLLIIFPDSESIDPFIQFIWIYPSTYQPLTMLLKLFSHSVWRQLSIHCPWISQHKGRQSVSAFSAQQKKSRVPQQSQEFGNDIRDKVHDKSLAWSVAIGSFRHVNPLNIHQRHIWQRRGCSCLWNNAQDSCDAFSMLFKQIWKLMARKSIQMGHWIKVFT